MVTGDHDSRVSDYTNCVIQKDEQDDGYVIRRLTPLECERLQGYPDGYTDIGDWVDTQGRKRKCADTPRYKALGDSIALPPWQFVLGNLSEVAKREGIEPPTMASLFDGIGGFPLIWERLGNRCLWTAEIDEFCMAVTRKRLGVVKATDK